MTKDDSKVKRIGEGAGANTRGSTVGKGSSADRDRGVLPTGNQSSGGTPKPPKGK